GADLIVKTVNGIASHSITEQPQAPTSATHAPKLNTETSRIDWSKPVADIHNLIRGLSPYPGAFTTLKNSTFKIYSSEFKEEGVQSAPGTFDTDHKTFLRFAAPNGYIYAKDVQAEGKKRMAIEDFLRGFR
ncbi:MAG: methionyl-tRNA formyltransferase, partial [Chitinophagaceae bacterium]